MAGGIFTIPNKVRPGAYINTKSELPKPNGEDRGVVLLMNGINYGWGKDGVIELMPDTDFLAALGTKQDDPSLMTVNEALKGATKVLLVNSNNGTPAKVSDDNLAWNISAKYNGSKGNNITIDLVQDVVDKTKLNVKTLFGTSIVDTQTIAMDKPERLENNDYVTFTVNEAKKDAMKTFNGQRSVKLSGGTDNPTTDLTAQMQLLGDALQKQIFTVATTAGFDEDSNIHALLVEMIKDLRDKQGYKVTCVVPYNGTKYDYEAVSVVENGVILKNGTIITPTVATAYFAGKSSSVPLNQSLTYADYDGAERSYPTIGDEGIIRSLTEGRIVFTDRRDGTVVIEQDINTLTTFTDTKSYQFHKNRELRALDEIANNTRDVFEKVYIGKVTNNDSGRNIFKGDRVAYFNQLAANNVIGNFDADDLRIAKGAKDDELTMDFSITPVDSMEKLYSTITVTR